MKRGEVQLTCPECEHPSFYFNMLKGVGFCHRCNWTPRRGDLARALRSRGIILDAPQLRAPQADERAKEIALPDDARPLLVEVGAGELVPHCELCVETIQYIEQDRRVSREKQFRFQLQATLNRIYVPIFDEAKLVNYLGRAKWWQGPCDKAKLYAPGASTSHHLYCWNDFRNLEEIALIENTFNALWLREHGVTTSFGSALSETQLSKISSSRVRSVVFLWDEGAGERAEKAVTRLRARGVRAVFARILGQPDQHTEACLSRIIRLGHQAAHHARKDVDVEHQPGACTW